ncbi:MAG: CvpA family protein [Candidatus Omnitrophota bacterium]|nr:CvpA family protein [Candidatus Omnitrophota bacterium]
MLDNILKYINWVDVLVVVLILRAGYLGFKTGVWHELLGLIGILVAIFIPFRNYAQLGKVIDIHSFLSLQAAKIVSFVLLMLAVLILVKLIRSLFKKLVKVEFISVIESLGGTIIGLVQAGLACGLILLVFTWVPARSLQTAITKGSYLGSRLTGAPPAIYDGFVRLYSGSKSELTGEEISDDLTIEQEKREK